MEALKSAVLLDIENLFIAVRKDLKNKNVRAGAKDIAEVLCGIILKFAGGRGRLKYLLGAVSLPHVSSNPDIDESGKYRVRKDMADVIQVFVDNGFEVMVKSSSYNAADFLLEKLARETKEDAEVEEVFLCSGDGQDPFPKIVNGLKEAGKRVSVIVYDKIPRGLREANNFILLNEQVHLELDESVESGGLVLRQPEISETNVNELPKKESLVKIYRNIIRDVKDGKNPKTRLYFERLCRALSVWEKYFRRLNNLPFSAHRLILILDNEFPEFESGEHRTLFYAVLDCTDFFLATVRYRVRTESRFLAKLRLVK